MEVSGKRYVTTICPEVRWLQNFNSDVSEAGSAVSVLCTEATVHTGRLLCDCISPWTWSVTDSLGPRIPLPLTLRLLGLKACPTMAVPDRIILTDFFWFFITEFLCVDLAVLELFVDGAPASASRVLGLNACATTAQLN